MSRFSVARAVLFPALLGWGVACGSLVQAQYEPSSGYPSSGYPTAPAQDYLPYPEYAGDDYVPLPYPQYADPPRDRFTPAAEGPQGPYGPYPGGGPAYSLPGGNEQPASWTGSPELVPAGPPLAPPLENLPAPAGEAPSLEGAVEEPVSEDSPEYQLFNPNYWFRSINWDGSVELGISGSTGNTETNTLRGGAKLNRKTELHSWAADLKYARTYADSLQTQHNAIGNLKYERLFQASPYTLFAKTGVEYDEFRAFDLRLIANAGIGYRLIDNDRTNVIFRFGAGVSHEFGGPDDSWVPEGVYGLEWKWKVTERQRATGQVEYFPDWSDLGEFRLVTDLGWEFVLDEEANLSLKLSATDRYDSTPNGLKPNDIDYALLLIYNLP